MKKNLSAVRLSRRLHLGRSMVEILGVLAIVGVLSIGGLVAYQQVLKKVQFKNALQFIDELEFAFYEECVLAQTCQFGYVIAPGSGKRHRQVICRSIGGIACIDARDSSYSRFPYFKAGDWGVSGFNEKMHYEFHLLLIGIFSTDCIHLLDTNWTKISENIFSISVSGKDYFFNEDKKLSPEVYTQARSRCLEKSRANFSVRWKIDK